MHQSLKIAIAASTALLLLSCTVPQSSQAPTATPRQTASTAPSAVPTLPGVPWQISNAESLITIEVLRGGPLAALGHNHVIAAKLVIGVVRVAEPVEQSSLSLKLPVAQFTVDEPQLRAKAGPDFAAAVPDSARSATRTNMLGASLLDAEHFPAIELLSKSIVRTAAGIDLELLIRVLDVPHTVHIPLAMRRESNRLSASGEVMLRQSELGLTPFSIMLGALQVQDQIRVKFTLVAQFTG